jgi:hypothetical protein
MRIDLFAGVVAYKDLIAEIDTNGDGALPQAELDAWIKTVWRPGIAFQIDKLTDEAPGAAMAATFAGPVSTLFLSEPLTILATIPIPTDGLPHELVVKDEYRWPQSDYQLQLLNGQGTSASLASNTGRVMVVNFETDPLAAGGNPVEADASIVLAKSKTGFGERVKSNLLWILVAVFALAVGFWLALARFRERESPSASPPKRVTKPTPRKK